LKKNLTLTGMMGVGKSTVGRALSKHLSMDFIDIDKIIEKKLKLTIQKVFEHNGEQFFRKFEEKVTLSEIKKKNQIISLGGGAFMNKKIRDSVISETKSFWLDLDNVLLEKRLAKSKKRPLLIKKNIKLTLEKIYNERKSTYSLANYKIDCNNLTTVLIVKKIIKLYENN
jgi:shikimate kinase